MKHPVTRTLYDYWNDLRGRRIAPRRFDIEPAAIAGILPDTIVLERVDPRICRFRVAGTRIVDAFGLDFRGVNIFDLLDEADRSVLQRQISVMARQGAGGRFELKAESEAGLGATFELVLLPLTHTRDIIDRFVGALAALDRPMWIGTVPFVRLRIVEDELIWPDGRGHPMIDAATAQHQAPFPPHFREARVVRFDRRQFRVYDGGLASPPDE